MSITKTGSSLAPERFVSSAHWMQSLSEWDMAAARTHAERAARHFARLGEQAVAALEAGDERAAEVRARARVKVRVRVRVRVWVWARVRAMVRARVRVSYP